MGISTETDEQYASEGQDLVVCFLVYCRKPSASLDLLPIIGKVRSSLHCLGLIAVHSFRNSSSNQQPAGIGYIDTIKHQFSRGTLPRLA